MLLLDELAKVVSEHVLSDALRVSNLLNELGVSHAIIGGLAVGFHGHPRATKDVDFLLSDDGFDGHGVFAVYRDELKEVAKVGVIDLMGVPLKYPVLKDFLALPSSDSLSVLPIEGLLLMKLDAGRAQDIADVSALCKLLEPVKLEQVFLFLRQHSPTLLNKLAEILEG